MQIQTINTRSGHSVMTAIAGTAMAIMTFTAGPARDPLFLVFGSLTILFLGLIGFSLYALSSRMHQAENIGSPAVILILSTIGIGMSQLALDPSLGALQPYVQGGLLAVMAYAFYDVIGWAHAKTKERSPFANGLLSLMGFGVGLGVMRAFF